MKTLRTTLAILLLSALTGCIDDAQIASNNLSRMASGVPEYPGRISM